MDMDTVTAIIAVIFAVIGVTGVIWHIVDATIEDEVAAFQVELGLHLDVLRSLNTPEHEVLQYKEDYLKQLRPCVAKKLRSS